ncbi:MAG: 5-formyltetrahydrofolate cyclo-ligase [Gammaproteobacteria bacterium]|nr:5-formyltetrahydrofolate cyclo-ligase [Gammaproteobacteria bacterium]
MRVQRRRLTPTQRAACAEQLARRLASTPLFKRSRRIACYLPIDGELDPAPLIYRALAMKKSVYLPVLVPLGTRLGFIRYRPGDRLALNRYGIPEPTSGFHARINPAALDLVLVPLVAFDSRGNRLGMGAGYYDRSFAYLKSRRHWNKPRLLGLAYEFQKVPRLPDKPWDVPLSGIATEKRVYTPAYELLADEIRTQRFQRR